MKNWLTMVGTAAAALCIHFVFVDGEAFAAKYDNRANTQPNFLRENLSTMSAKYICAHRLERHGHFVAFLRGENECLPKRTVLVESYQNLSVLQAHGLLEYSVDL